MSRNLKLLLPAALVAGLAVAVSSSANAVQIIVPGACVSCSADPFLVTFDETGKATIAVNGGPSTTLTGTLQTDPANKVVGAPLALTFKLPEPVVSGDVSFSEPGGGISDWLRFTDATGIISGGGTAAASTVMLFYSDVGDIPLALADTGFAANLGTGLSVARAEVGAETATDGFDYRPGGVPYPQNNEYLGTSDVAVPEPATIGLLGIAMAATGLVARRRRRAVQERPGESGPTGL